MDCDVQGVPSTPSSGIGRAFNCGGSPLDSFRSTCGGSELLGQVRAKHLLAGQRNAEGLLACVLGPDSGLGLRNFAQISGGREIDFDGPRGPPVAAEGEVFADLVRPEATSGLAFREHGGHHLLERILDDQLVASVEACRLPILGHQDLLFAGTIAAGEGLVDRL